MRSWLRVAVWGVLLGSLVLGDASLATVKPPSAVSATPPPVSVAYDNIPFYYAYVGQSLVGTLTFGTYSGPITLTGVSLVGPNTSSFSIVANTCTSGVVLAGSATCQVRIKFTPQAAGELDADLELGTTVGPFDVSLGGGMGLVASILVSPTRIDFGFESLGQMATRTVTLINPNPIPVQYDWTYYGFDSTVGFDFGGNTTTCGAIPANGSCTYQITYTPTATGPESGNWFAVTSLDDSHYEPTDVIFTGTGVTTGIASADISKSFNLEAIGVDSGHVQGGGADGLGNVYATELLANPLAAAGQTFNLGPAAAPDAVADTVIPITPGNYFGISLLATAVRGNQPNQHFVINYADGSSTTITQSLSDWHTPQKYTGETVATTTAYRLTADGVRHNGPYSLYTYTLPAEHTKQVVSLKLPASHSVVVLAVNLNSIGVAATADLSKLYNITAVTQPGAATSDGGIDGLNNTIDTQLLLNDPTFPTAFGAPPTGGKDGVNAVTVSLPAGTYSSLRLFGVGVRGNHPNQRLTLTYKDGTSTELNQSFSDWHTPQNYPGESIALVMRHRLNGAGAAHAGFYDIYQYDLPIDPTKQVDSLKLPDTAGVVILQVDLEP